ncbi:hypothetical protein [Aliterella atlantica]|uniref:LapA family protein n=1 Tax=Aliterella atlantica CENA595 TaxID=1618023 RepID=A0A0D8ZSX2_9CYAN|nr:hypothetical protein [Aliterella atlantica]KJH71858.1 hypothetical protein UH38_10805 [Aliterella atlantica CENA595]
MRIILLLVILGGLTLLLVQNWSPVLPLVFLGVTTPALPLAVWILFSLAAGASTSLAIASLLQLTNFFSQPKSSSQRQVQPPPRTQSPPKQASYTATSTVPPKTSPPPSDPAIDDWQESSNEDWDFEEDDKQSPPQDRVQDSRNYEKSSEPKSGYQTGSVYSYNYREPSDSGVGRTESVYDADYRVLTPPYREPEKVQEQEEEDWGFDDDEFEDEDDAPTKGR